MIYPERMTPYDAAILIYSQCYHNGDTPLKKSCHITSYPHECSVIRDAICEAIDDEALKWKPPKNCNSGFYGHMKDGASRDCQRITISKTDLKTWLEEFHPELKPAFLFGAEGTPGDEIADILNPDHPWHSELLAIAVKGWLELYSNREGNSSDNTHKPPGGHIAMIKGWLSGQISPLISKTSIGYLGKVINPSKGGGPNKSQE